MLDNAGAMSELYGGVALSLPEQSARPVFGAKLNGGVTTPPEQVL